MALTSTSNRVVATGDDVSTVFYFNRLLYDATHLQVYLDAALQTSGYTVNGVEDPWTANDVTFTVPPGTGVQVLLLRVVPLTQLSVYNVAGAFPAKTTEKNLDLAMMGNQQFDERLTRSLTVPVSETSIASIPLVAIRANKYFTYDSSGNPTATDAATASGTSVLSTGSTTARLLADRFAEVFNVKD